MPIEMKQVDDCTWVVTDPRYTQQGRLERRKECRKQLPWWMILLLEAYVHGPRWWR